VSETKTSSSSSSESVTKTSSSVSETKTSSSSSSRSSYQEGEICWGHDDTPLPNEEYIKDFDVNWVGSGAVVGSGNEETIEMSDGQYMEMDEPWYSGAGETSISYDQYRSGSGGTPAIQWKTGDSKANCEADTWNDYVGSFTSEGWVKVRVSK
jgi:hypothetical protein